MMYNDFPILNEDDYSVMKEHFNIPKLDRTTLANHIYNAIKQTELSVATIQNEYNSKTTTAIKQLANSLNYSAESIKTTFHINTSINPTIQNFNLFLFLSETQQILNQIFTIFCEEEKAYFKQVYKNIYTNLSNKVNNLLLSLSKSKVTFYHFM